MPASRHSGGWSTRCDKESDASPHQLLSSRGHSPADDLPVVRRRRFLSPGCDDHPRRSAAVQATSMRSKRRRDDKVLQRGFQFPGSPGRIEEEKNDASPHQLLSSRGHAPRLPLPVRACRGDFHRLDVTTTRGVAPQCKLPPCGRSVAISWSLDVAQGRHPGTAPMTIARGKSECNPRQRNASSQSLNDDSCRLCRGPDGCSSQDAAIDDGASTRGNGGIWQIGLGAIRAAPIIPRLTSDWPLPASRKDLYVAPVFAPLALRAVHCRLPVRRLVHAPHLVPSRNGPAAADSRHRPRPLSRSGQRAGIRGRPAARLQERAPRTGSGPDHCRQRLGAIAGRGRRFSFTTQLPNSSPVGHFGSLCR
jgi:hypothetical protein